MLALRRFMKQNTQMKKEFVFEIKV